MASNTAIVNITEFTQASTTRPTDLAAIYTANQELLESLTLSQVQSFLLNGKQVKQRISNASVGGVKSVAFKIRENSFFNIFVGPNASNTDLTINRLFVCVAIAAVRNKIEVTPALAHCFEINGDSEHLRTLRRLASPGFQFIGPLIRDGKTVGGIHFTADMMPAYIAILHALDYSALIKEQPFTSTQYPSLKSFMMNTNKVNKAKLGSLNAAMRTLGIGANGLNNELPVDYNALSAVSDQIVTNSSTNMMLRSTKAMEALSLGMRNAVQGASQLMELS